MTASRRKRLPRKSEKPKTVSGELKRLLPTVILLGAMVLTAIALVGCASVGVGIPIFPGVSIGVSAGRGGLNVGVGAGVGPVGVGVGMNTSGQISAGAGVGVGTNIGGAQVGVGVGTSSVIFDPLSTAPAASR